MIPSASLRVELGHQVDIVFWVRVIGVDGAALFFFDCADSLSIPRIEVS